MRIHIVGCPRSGTTLMMELMATCFDTVRLAPHELSIFQRPSSAQASPDEVLLSKQPTDVLHIKRLLEHDPNLYVLALTRDPRAVITSFHTHCEHFFVNYRIWQQCDEAVRALIGHPRVLHMRYEDLVSYADIHQQIIRHVFGFLEQRCRFSEYSRYARPDTDSVAAMNGLRPIDTKGIGKWRKQLPRVKHQLQLYPQMQEALEFHQYEVNADWQRAIADVPAIEYTCRYPERANVLKEWEKQLRVWLKTQRYIHTLALQPM